MLFQFTPHSPPMSLLKLPLHLEFSSVPRCIFPAYGPAQYLLSMKAPHPGEYHNTLQNFLKILNKGTGPTPRNSGLIGLEQQSSHISVTSESLLKHTRWAPPSGFLIGTSGAQALHSWRISR